MANPSTLLSVAAGALLAALALDPHAAEVPPITTEKFLGMRMLRSPSGRFVGYGTNSAHVSDLVVWADSTATRVDRLLDAASPQVRRPIRLVLTADPASTSGWARVLSVSPAVHIAVANYETVDIMAVSQALVRGLLYEFSAYGATQKYGVVTVPEWLVEGMTRNLEPEVREADYDAVHAEWSMGKVPPLAECFSGVASGATTNAAMAGMLVQWMLSLPDRGACIRDVLSRASGGAVPRPEWFLAYAGCRTPADLDTAWERWLVGRQWTVGAPGRRAGWMLERIRSELLIYPADSGIPNGKPGDPPLAMKDLIRERKEDWARAAASSRAVRLRLLAAGRGSEVADVLEAYSRFLEAVHEGTGETRLKALLGDADKRFAALEAGMASGAPAESRPAPVSGAGHGRTNR